MTKPKAEAKETLDKQAFSKLHEQSFVLFGIILSLAIEQALEGVGPYIFNPQPGSPGLRLLEGLRLSTFLVVSLRFFLGTVIFFSYAHPGPDPQRNKGYRQVDYASDILLGFTLFVLFFLWAFTIDARQRPMWLFPFFLLVILAWDALWWWIRRKQQDEHKLMRRRANMNGSYLLISILLYPLFKLWVPEIQAEFPTLFFLLAVCLIDILLLAGSKFSFGKTRDRKSPTGKPATR